MSKVPRKDIEEEDIYSWEESYGTDTTYWSEEHQMQLPYWVQYMPEPEKTRYINKIRQSKDFD